MRNFLLLSGLLFFISCGNKTGKEYFFKVNHLPQRNDNSRLLSIQKVTMFYLSNSRKDMNNICFNIKINESKIKDDIRNIRFRLFHNNSGFEYISMFPPTVSEEETIYICFNHYRMEGTRFDSIVNSMEKVSTKEKIKITKGIIRNIDLYLYLDDNDSIRIPLDRNAKFSFYLRDKSMMNVY